jgi:hypothetical protein
LNVGPKALSLQLRRSVSTGLRESPIPSRIVNQRTFALRPKK